MERRIYPGFLVLAAFLAGCAAHKVDADPAPLLKAGEGYSAVSPAAKDFMGGKPWHESFKSPELEALVRAALADNLSVREAVMRLKQAGALVKAASAARMPEISADADALRRVEEGRTTARTSTAAVAAAWEVDAFDRLGAALTARRFDEKAAAEDIAALRLSLVAEVAGTWYRAVAEQLELNLLRQQIAADKELLGLIQSRFEAGIGTEVEVLQQKSQLAETESLIPPAEAALREFENRLDVLAGQAPDGKNRTSGKARYAAIGAPPKVGVPSDLLLNRPDLRAARNRLVAADARIGAAIADRMPRITLTGSMFYADALSGAGGGASLLAGLVQPILDWGRREAEVERNKALYEGELAAFTRAYIEAVEEVENVLYRESRQREFVARLEARRKLLESTLKAAEAVYKQGESDYMPVLDAVKALRALERALVGERLNLILLRIRLFRAIGAPVEVSQ